MWQMSRRIITFNKFSGRYLLNRSDAISVNIWKTYFARGKQNDSTKSFAISKLFQPAPAKKSADASLGAELTGTITKSAVLTVLNKFSQKTENQELCKDYGLDAYIRDKGFASFRQYCFQIDELPAELYIKLYDIINGAGHPDDLFPYFLKHAREVYPHLNCMTDLKKISDLTTPANWYPEARSKMRKIIFHAGPTNSGKTYQAMQRFLNAESGIYCGPLKLLAMEVFQKSNEKGTVCDLVTGEEKKFGNPDGTTASHVAITVEMAPVDRRFDVAIIDEIQLLKDQGRGWAWTRAFLGINADEVHVCGEAGTRDLLERLCLTTGEILEYNYYDRLTKLTVEEKALESFSNLQPGDCIVCFNKNDIYAATREIEALGKEVAVIYGSLPPNTKLMQAAKFNDPENPCKTMVATDAIGMGLNLSIRRIIFYSLFKLQMTEKGEKEMSTISISSALQIAGRAGRFGTQWEDGYVTTFRRTDLPTLQYLLSQKPEPITQAGLHPTADQIELYAYHLPASTLSNLLDIFTSLSTVNDDLYFMCNTDDFKFLADMIQHVPLSLRARYVFCCSPVNRNQLFVCAMYLRFANQYSKYRPITFEFVAENCALPVGLPKTIADLIQLENIFDVMDIYLWLSYRFTDMFPHAEEIRAAQTQLDDLIQQGVAYITKLIEDSRASSENVIISENIITERKENTGSSAQSIKTVGEMNEIHLAGSGKLSDRLVQQGVISPSLMARLQKELLKELTEKEKKSRKLYENSEISQAASKRDYDPADSRKKTNKSTKKPTKKSK